MTIAPLQMAQAPRSAPPTQGGGCTAAPSRSTERIRRTTIIDDELRVSHLSARAADWLVVHRGDCAPDSRVDLSSEAARAGSPPIVILAASDDERDHLLRELPAHIADVIRRRRTPERRVIDVQELRIDVDAHRVTVAGQDVFFTRVEFKLLVWLAERPERVQSRGELLADVWGIAEPIQTRTVDTHVKRLRDKLGAAGRFIQAVRGVGYRFGETPGRPRTPNGTIIRIHPRQDIPAQRTEADTTGVRPSA